MFSRLAWLLLLVLALSACEKNREVPQFRIGLLTDIANSAGPSTIAAAELSVRELEEAGGLQIGGVRHRVVVKIAATDESPEGAARAMQHLLQQEQVDIIAGPMISRSALAAAPLAEKARIPMVTQGATHPEITRDRPYVFRATFSDPILVDVIVRFLSEEIEAEHVAVLYDLSSVYSRTVAENFKKKWQAHGGRISSENYVAGQESFIEQLTRLRDAKADILLLPNYNADVIVQAREARAIGLDLPLIGSDSWTPEELLEDPALSGSYLFKAWHLKLGKGNPQAQRFIQIYHQAQREDPLSGTALTWDAFHLIFDAARRAGSTEPEALRDALADTVGFRGVVGEITLRGTGGDPRKSMVVLRIIDGQVELHRMIAP